MYDLGQYFSSDEINVAFKKGLKGSLILRREDGLVPIELNKNELLMFVSYPFILNELINGRKLYIKKSTAYIGEDVATGPYGEDKYFLANYTSSSSDFYELLGNLEKSVKKNDVCKKKVYRYF